VTDAVSQSVWVICESHYHNKDTTMLAGWWLLMALEGYIMPRQFKVINAGPRETMNKTKI